MNSAAHPQPVTLTTCDTEPIQFLGAIQSVGFLLTVNADWIVLRASENIQSALNVSHDRIVGAPLADHMSAELMHEIRGCLQVAAGGPTERLFGQRLTALGPKFDLAIHQSGPEIVIEFEPSEENVRPPMPLLRAMFARISRHHTSNALFREATRQIRGLTGFDRVMVYRFDEDGAGEIVAESAAGGLQSFLGLHYPASDIPVQARALYEKKYVRSIADVNAAAVPVTPLRSPEGDLLDLSMSVLRSVSPIHIEYLRNMGVRASMSISILRAGKLWGLFACHHYEPKHVGLESRSVADLFGQMFSLLLETRQCAEDAAYEERTRAIHDRIAAAFADPKMLMRNVPEFLAGVSDYVEADGIGAYYNGEVTLTGTTPTREEFVQLVKFLNKTAYGRVFATHRLSETYPRAADFVMRAAGLLSIPISRVPRDYLVFFRREVAKTVTWAGEPGKIDSIGPNGPRLTPRKSFEAWRESVHHQSKRWAKTELRAAENLRMTLVELVLRLADAAQADRRGAEQHQELLIAELNHRVRNILGLVRGLITQSAESAADLGSFVDSLHHRIGTLANAHDLLTSSNWGPASLHALLRTSIEEQIRLIGPDVLLEPRAVAAMAMVVHELVTNARKYGALSNPSGEVIVETSSSEVGNVAISWRETGGPPVSRPVRRGFGTTILEQVIPFDVSGSTVSHYLPEGFAFDITLPPAVATCIERSAPMSAEAKRPEKPARTHLTSLLNVSLVVEDNLFIAIDAEDLLNSLGAAKVVVVKSVASAHAAIAKQQFSFALLDVNLGSENCLPIARELAACHTPFAFGTGYGESLALPEAMNRFPIISKPYRRDAMAKALTQLAAAAGAVPAAGLTAKV